MSSSSFSTSNNSESESSDSESSSSYYSSSYSDESSGKPEPALPPPSTLLSNLPPPPPYDLPNNTANLPMPTPPPPPPPYDMPNNTANLPMVPPEPIAAPKSEDDESSSSSEDSSSSSQSDSNSDSDSSLPKPPPLQQQHSPSLGSIKSVQIDHSMFATKGSIYLKEKGSNSITSMLQSKIGPSSSTSGIMSQYFSTQLELSKSQSIFQSVVEKTADPKPFEKQVEPDYVSEINNEEFENLDNNIDKFISKNKQYDKEEFSEHIIKEVNEIENPFKSPNAEKLKERGKHFAETIPVQFFSENVQQLKFNNVKEPKRREFRPSEHIKFLNDPRDIPGSKGKPSILGSYSMGQPEAPPREEFKPVKLEDLEMEKTLFAALSFKDFQMKPSLVEPLLFTACLYSEKKFISEEWHFTTEPSKELYNDKVPKLKISLNHKAAFQIPKDISTSDRKVYLVIAISHPLTVADNAPVKKYYQTEQKVAEAKKNIGKTFPRNKEILSTFAWTYVNVTELLRPRDITLPKAFEMNEPFQASHLKELINDANKKKLKSKYNFELTLSTNQKNVIHPLTELAEYEPIFLTEPPPPSTKPSTHLVHKLQLRLDDVNFKAPSGIKARNIFGVVSLKKGDEGETLKAVHSHLNPPEVTEKSSTRCFYHNTKGVFDEVFVFDLPYPIPDSLCVFIEFFHLICKNSSNDRSKIGTAKVQIVKNGKFIEDGTHQIQIKYAKGKSPKADSSNRLSVQTMIVSSLVSSDSNLQSFYDHNGLENSQLTDVKTSLLLENLYHLIEMIINNIGDNPSAACTSLSVLYKILEADFPQISNYFSIYSQVFSMRDTNKVNHAKIFEGLAIYTNIDSQLYKPLLMIAIKSLFLTKDTSFGKEFSDFLNSVPKRIATEAKTNVIVDFAEFLTLLFDIGRYSAAIEGVYVFIKEFAYKDEVSLFISNVFRPKLFYLSIMQSNKMIMALQDLLRYSRAHDNKIFQVLVQSLEILPEEMISQVAERLLDTLPVISPLQKIPFIKQSGSVHPAAIYFALIIERIQLNQTVKEWFSSLIEPEAFCDSLHFLLDLAKINDYTNVRECELSYALQSAVINVLEIMINCVESMRIVTSILYHFLWVNIVSDYYSKIIQMLIIIAKSDISFLFEYCNPALPKFLIRLFKYCNNDELFSEFLDTIISLDSSFYGNTKRSMGLICRSLYALNEKELLRISIKGNSQNIRDIKDLIENYANTLIEYSKPNISFARKSQLIGRKLELLRPSPDAVVEILSELIKLNEEAGYDSEAFQTKLLISAIVIEVLTLQNRIKPLFNEIHASKVFARICSMVPLALIPEDSCPTANGYCDSAKFNLKSVMALLTQANNDIATSQKDILYESAIDLIDILWPLFEHYHIFFYTKRFFQFQTSLQKFLSSISPETERLFGKFFRVSFYGKVFRDNNGKTFIYHERGLTHLFDFSKSVVDQYQKELSGVPIELIKEAGPVDTSKLNSDTGYIQVTFVEPYFPREEMYKRITKYDKNHMVKSFYFDTPFTQGEKVQSTIDKQWLRRTILYVEYPMPSIFKIQAVNHTVVREFEPIRVSYRQLRDRCQQLLSAIGLTDFRTIQQLLHGSLLVMVNEGPSRMAEVFLSPNSKQEGDPNRVDKYKRKLSYIFQYFLKNIGDALSIHSRYATENPMFITLQNELESGYFSLKEKLEKYI